MQTGQKRISIVLLSIILPVGLLTGLRLTGMLRGPSTPEVLTVDTVGWSMSRPSDSRYVIDVVNNSYVDSVVSIDYVVEVFDYYENDGQWAGFDVVPSVVRVNMSVDEGFVESVIVNFTQLDGDAALDINGDTDHIQAVNLDVARIDDWDWVFGKNAYIKATGINKPGNTYLQFQFAWMFKDPNSSSHRLTITLEATYVNGNTYHTVRIPVQLDVFES